MAQDWFDSATSGAPQPASGPRGGTVIRNPWKAKEEARKDEDQAIQWRQLGLQEEANRRAAEANAATIANMNKPPAGYRWGPPDAQGNPTMQVIPGGPADKAPAANPERAPQIRALLGSISRLRELAEKRLAVGNWSASFKDNALFNQNRKNVEGALEQIEGDMIQQQIMLLNEASGGKGVASLANSETEARRMAASIANLNPDQDLAEFKRGLDEAENYYLRQAAKLEGGALDSSLIQNYLPAKDQEQAMARLGLAANGGGGAPGAGGGSGGGSPGPYQNDPSGNRTFLTERDKAFAEEAQAAFRNGADRAAMDAIAQKYGAQPFGEDLDNAIASRRAGNASVQFAPTPTGFEEAGLTGAIMGPWASGNLGSYAIGAGNAVTAGQLGNIAELTGSSEGGTAVAMDMAQDNAIPYFLGELSGGALATFGAGKALGAGSRLVANPTVVSLLANPMTADAAYGAAFGASEADDPLYGALGGAATAVGGSWLGSKVGHMMGGSRIDDPLNKGERAVINAMDRGTGISVEEALQQGQDLGLPMTLSDVSPEVAALAGSAIRRNPTVAGNARDMLARRSQGQIDRFRGAVARDLGPVTNIPQRSEELIQQARREAGPLYDQFNAYPMPDDFDVATILARPSAQSAMPKAANLVREDDLNPYHMGFVLNDAGDFVLPEVGRYVEARGPKPPSPISVISGQGNSAPSDLLTFVRRNGGLVDQGGELSFMDIGTTKAGRKGVPMAGQDARLDPIINPNGRSYEDMAQAAWEAGYFGPPSSAPRPTEREFLEALEDTYRGNDRKFSIHDEDVVNQYDHYQRLADEWNAAEGIMADRSVPGGPQDFAPASAFGSMQPVAPQWQTLDYLKRGLDDVVQGNKSANMGRLDTAGSKANNTRADLINAIDAVNPHYAPARAAYAGPMQEREALERGMEAIRANPDQLSVDVANIPEPRMNQWRLGMQSGLVGQAENLSNSTNPFRILNTPAMEQRLNILYPDAGDDVARLLLQRDLENKMAGTSNFLAGNSATAERAIADQAFADEGLLRPIVEGGVETAITGAPVATILRSGVGQRAADMFRLGSGRRAMERAEQIAPIALNPDPADTIAQILAMQERQAGYQAAVEAAKEAASRRGGHLGTAATTGTYPYWMGD